MRTLRGKHSTDESEFRGRGGEAQGTGEGRGGHMTSKHYDSWGLSLLLKWIGVGRGMKRERKTIWSCYDKSPDQKSRLFRK